MYKVKGHTAPITGAFWFIVVNKYGIMAPNTPYFDDYESAQYTADELNGLNEVNND